VNVEHRVRAEESWIHEAIVSGDLDPACAYTGLSEADVERLVANPRFRDKPLLVRLRTAESDGRTVLPAHELLRWNESAGEQIVLDDGRAFVPGDIRDVFPFEGTA